MLPNPTTGVDPDRVGGWIQLYSGAPFWPLDPRAEEIDIRDIARALSMQCRYAGHVRTFYSVAEHSVHVSCLVPAEHALWGLLHDATEAYLQDLVQPIKAGMPLYRAWEDGLMWCIAERFGLPWPMPDAVKAVDRRMLMNEKAIILNPSHRAWDSEAPISEYLALPCFQPYEAEAVFCGGLRS